jgi:hypothetical protein
MSPGGPSGWEVWMFEVRQILRLRRDIWWT